jgi:hypothetical protein
MNWLLDQLEWRSELREEKTHLESKLRDVETKAAATSIALQSVEQQVRDDGCAFVF